MNNPRRGTRDDGPRINGEITAEKIRLIDAEEK